MTRETEDLESHVALCAMRYQGIQDQFHRVDQSLVKIEDNLEQIKALIAKNRDARTNTIITAVATVAVAIISALGYIVVKMS